MIEWFVIYNNEHLGPFSENVLHQLYKEGDVKKETLIWRDGMAEPTSYESNFIYTKEEQSFKPLTEVTDYIEQVNWDIEESLPPPLPPLPLEKTRLESDSILQQKTEEEEVREQKSVDEVKTTKRSVVKQDNQRLQKKKSDPEIKKEENPEAFLNSLVSEDIKKEAKKIEKSSLRNKFFLITGLLILLIFLVPAIFIVKNIYMSFTRPEQMSLIDFSRLKDVSKNSSVENKFALAVSKDRSKIWLATNNPYQGNIILKIRSIKEKTLTNQNVEAVAKAKLKGKIAEFSKLTFTKGAKLIDGYYYLEVYTTKDLEEPWFFSLYSKRKRKFRFFHEQLFSQLSEENFKKELNKTKNIQTQNDMAFWEELSQKYQTVKMITLQIKNQIDASFESPNNNWRSELQKFEKRYKTDFGNFFTNFVIQNDQSYNELKQKEFSNKLEIISNYNRLSSLAREVGKATMDIFHEMETFDGIDDARKEILWKRARLRLQNIVNTCDEKIKMIQIEQ